MRRIERLRMELKAKGTSVALSGRDIEPIVPACVHCGLSTIRVDNKIRRCILGHRTEVQFSSIGRFNKFVEWKSVYVQEASNAIP